jgi:uncharacterized protein YkwD
MPPVRPILACVLVGLAAPAVGSAACVASVVSAQDEAALLTQVNNVRAKVGLLKLASAPSLLDSARSHSAQMALTGKLQHQVRAGRLTWAPANSLAGENLAVAPDASIAMDALLKSPKHRDNILAPGFRRIGIGAVRDCLGMTYFTQEFLR